MNWSGADIQEALGLSTKVPSLEASGISIDSRTVREGDIFIALRGEKFDGYDYIPQALDRGAIAIIAEQFYPTPEGVACFEYYNSLQALQRLGEFARSRLDCKVVGITGSVGKTTTKEMLLQAFSAFGQAHASYGNFNNDIGLPLVLVNCPEDIDFLILEMGMNHAGEIDFLTNLGKPDLAIVTNVKVAHMMNFADIEGVAHAKAEIFSSQPEQALFLGDDELISQILLESAESANIKEIRKFAINDNALTKFCHYRFEGMTAGKKPKVTANFQQRQIEYFIAMLGEHSAINSMIAMAAVDMVLGNLPDLRILEDFTAPKGRGALSQIKLPEGGTATLIDESYNASPASVSASLNLLADVKEMHQAKRSVAILGDMLELGDAEISYHTSLASDIEACGVDKLITVGHLMRHLYDSVPSSHRLEAYSSSDSLMEDIWNYIKKDDIILLKGSHSVGLEKIVLQLQEKE